VKRIRFYATVLIAANAVMFLIAWRAADCRIEGITPTGIFVDYGRGKSWEGKDGWFGVSVHGGRVHFMHFTASDWRVRGFEFPPYSGGRP
jgi:hypothetical protein